MSNNDSRMTPFQLISNLNGHDGACFHETKDTLYADFVCERFPTVNFNNYGAWYLIFSENDVTNMCAIEVNSTGIVITSMRAKDESDAEMIEGKFREAIDFMKDYFKVFDFSVLEKLL